MPLALAARMLPAALLLLLAMLSPPAGAAGPWNNPYPDLDPAARVLYSAFSGRPKHLDPARSYAEDEAVFTAQIYMPPLQYHYLERPYRLVPYAALTVPRARLLDADGRELPADSPDGAVAESVYDIRLRPGMYYQPHPALAAGADGRLRYLDLDGDALAGVETLADFAETGSREVVAADYVHQIKRLADPSVQSPIFGLMSRHILGMDDFARRLGEGASIFDEELPGAEVVDRYHYRIRLKGRYPQFVYWLAMVFFAPVPPEADRFYRQPGLAERNISLDWYPIGSGPFMLTENDPNRRMVLSRNPGFVGETYPDSGAPGDREAGLLADAGRPLPFIDQAVFTLEKESIPYWNKFLQGWYDASGISSDSFDQAVQTDGGDVSVSEEMAGRGISLQTAVATSVMYLGFNMLDPVVGGDSEGARKLRLAVSLAVDFEEFISIFANGRGIIAQGPIPPGIFGHQDGPGGVNPYLYRWRDGRAELRSIEHARQLLAEAGWPGGRHRETGEPLVLYLDTTATGLGAKARLDWLTRQFARIGVQLVPRSTDWNRFQDKIRQGNAQIFFMGWNADYPDPENFLFLFVGSQSRVKTGGENSTNYDNPEYDRLFIRMRNLENGPEREAVIARMVAMLQHDAPWAFGYYPVGYTLVHSWLHNRKPNTMANNTLKYQRVEPELRQRMRDQWNPPRPWPALAALAMLALVSVPGWLLWRRRERGRGRC